MAARAEKRPKGKRKIDTEPKQYLERRQFLVKSAVMALFGTVGIDAVVDSVLRRMQDFQSTRHLAERIASEVQRTGLSGTAMADHDPGEEQLYCPA